MTRMPSVLTVHLGWDGKQPLVIDSTYLCNGDRPHGLLRTSYCAGGLTENDFIIAARINAIAIKDLLPKPKMRFWA